MSFFLRALLVLLPVFAIWAPPSVLGQTVSIFSVGTDSTSRTIEAHLKQNLRQEGYTVRGGTIDGFLVILNAMPIYQTNTIIGYSGTVVIGSLDWVQVSNALLPRGCPADLVSKMKSLLGIDFILIDSNMRIAGSEQDLALELSEIVNKSVRTGSQKIAALLKEIGQRERRQ